MTYSYEEYRVFYYVNQLLDWAESNALEEQALERGLYYWTKGYRLRQPAQHKKESPKSYIERAGNWWKKEIAKLAAQALQQEPGYLAQNLDFLEQIFELKPEEKLILEFLTLYHTTELLGRFACRFNEHTSGNLSMLLHLLHCSRCDIDKLTGRHSKLRNWGFIESGRFERQTLSLQDEIGAFLTTPYKDQTERRTAFVGECLESLWKAKDFDFIQETSLALKLFKRASLEKGCNILLYGEPGTGKTSFAAMLARHVGKKLYTVCETREDEDEEQASNRLKSLYRKQKILAKVTDACLLFDEAEDIFSPMYSKRGRYNKVEMNRLLENNACPVIWTTNSIRAIDPAFVRRFTLAIHFEKPSLPLRQKMWKGYLTKNRLPATPKIAQTLAREFEVAPALIAGASRAARLVKGDISTVKKHLSLMTQALNGGYKKPEEARKTESFCPALIHADMDLNALTEQLKGLGRLNFSLCLYGASGTGKSAYARYLAEELGLDVLHRRASDLIGAFVGETEQNIAAAFAQAKEDKAMLIFDEADSFLRDRSMASHSWEISGVNEMLTWMESHPYPFICTTNLMDTLDPASLRRFSFKIKYDFLTPQQVVCAFMFFFHVMIDEKDVVGLNKLTPGDFALVKNKAEILGHAHDFYALKEMLETEQTLKQNRSGGRIGFTV